MVFRQKVKYGRSCLSAAWLLVRSTSAPSGIVWMAFDFVNIDVVFCHEELKLWLSVFAGQMKGLNFRLRIARDVSRISIATCYKSRGFCGGKSLFGAVNNRMHLTIAKISLFQNEYLFELANFTLEWSEKFSCE